MVFRLILDTPWMRAVLAVISDGLSVSQVAEKVGVSRQTLPAWLARYQAAGLDDLSASGLQSPLVSRVSVNILWPSHFDTT